MRKFLVALALSLFAFPAWAQTPSQLPGCIYNATPPTLSDKQSIVWQCDVNGKLLTTLPAGVGDVVGPASSTDNAIVRFDSTTGKLIQNGIATESDDGLISILGTTLTAPGVQVGITTDTIARVAMGLNATDIPRISFGPGGASARDLFLERSGAATLRFGQTDAASAVAQTIIVQGVVAGTMNVAGATTTFKGSASTGSAAGGSIVFQTTAAGSSGTSQNAFATALTLDSAGGGTFAGNMTVSQGATVAWAGRSALTSPNSGTISFNQLGSPFEQALLSFSTANLRLGAANAASPVAQLLSAQGSRAGTDSNVGGANLSVQSGLGTGIGTPSNLILNGIVGTTTGMGTQAASAGLTIAGVATGQLPSVILGSAALATNASDGFLYIASGAGTPTGTPTAVTGRVPMYVDTTNSQLWFYMGGAWKQPKTPAAAAIITWQ